MRPQGTIAVAIGAKDTVIQYAAHSLYAGARAVFATMHGKERAVAPVLKARLGLDLVTPPGLDTDALGTFTGEVPRPGDMVETAILKARAGMAAAGLPLGLASEGSYGAHPQIPFVNAGVEVLVLVDDERGLIIREELIDDAPVFDHTAVRAGDDLAAFLARARFPSHALIVRPHEGAGPIVKGLQGLSALKAAIAEAAAASPDGFARVETDMRADRNPTRMAAIARLAEKFAERVLTPCPACAAPGFGLTGVERGLLCAECGLPTDGVKAEIHACTQGGCGYEHRRPRRDGLTQAEARWCGVCNP